MATEASYHGENISRAVAYSVYNLGVGILIGLIRTIIAVAYIAKHAFYAEKYEQAHDKDVQKQAKEYVQKELQREREISEAKEKTKKATGLGKVGAWFSEKKTELKNAVGEVKDEFVFEAKKETANVQKEIVRSTEKARKEEWYGQLFRGLTEMVWVGAPYYTYQDNFSKNHKVSIFGMKELGELLKNEHELDGMIQAIVGKQNYNPII